MAEVKNQYGTFQTDKKLGSKRLPSNSDLETKAQKLYGKNFDELTIQQRTQLRTGARGAMSIADDVTFEQYLDDYKNMAGDANYKPKYIKPNLGSGMSTQQKRARAEAKNSVEAFEQKFQKNVNKRKQLKRNANPEKRTQDLASKAERRVTRRIKEKDIALTPREKNINLEQRKLAKEYNAPIRKNPNMVLGNKALMEKLSITISKDGDIIKIPTTLNKKYLSERGLFEIDHQRDIYKKGKGKNLPYNRNLIMGPYNRSGGFKDMAEKFIAANPNSPKIESILKQAEDLKVTLQPDVPTGTFKTKGIGYKQASDPLEKFKQVYDSDPLEKFKQVYDSEPKNSPFRKKMDNIVKCADGCFIKVANKNPEKTLTKLNKNTDELKAIFATPEVTNIKAPLVNSLSGQIRPELPSVKYNNITGAMVNTANGEKATAADMKKFEVDNPLKTVAGTEDAYKPIKKSMLKTVGRTLAKIGAPLPTALIDGYFVGKQIQDDKSAVEIAKDPLNWLGLATMSTLTKVGGVTGSGTANSILRMGMSPGLIRGVSRFAGLPGLAISTALTAYDQYEKYKNEEGLIYNLFNDKATPV